MSLTLTLTGDTSTLTAEYFPPIQINSNYVCGLVDFQTYNSIPNVDESNNLFHIGTRVIEIPIGSYELDDISNYIKSELTKSGNTIKVELKSNNNTLRSIIKGNDVIYFNKKNSIGSLLGFSNRELNPNTIHTSDLPVNIIKVNTIRIQCNIVTGSYINNIKTRTLHEFSPIVGPGKKKIFTFIRLQIKIFFFFYFRI